MARVGVAVPGMGCGGRGDSQTFVWQMRAGCSFLIIMGTRKGHPQTKIVYCIISPLSKWEQGSLSLFQVVVGLGVPPPTGAITSLYRCPAGPTPGQ